MPIYVDLTTVPGVVPGAYCTIAQARAEGATGTDAEVQAAIEHGAALIDRITGAWWDVRAATVRAHVDSNGEARLPRRVVTVTDVRRTGSGAMIGPGAYRLESSSVVGGRDRLLFGRGYGNGLSLVYEPLRGWDDEQRTVDVTGTFGTTQTPTSIVEANARLAAAFTGAGGAVNVEGDADLGTPPQVPSLTAETLPPEVSALLAPYVTRRSLVS